MLNAKLKQRFQEDGYVMLEQAIDPNTLEALLEKLDQYQGEMICRIARR